MDYGKVVSDIAVFVLKRDVKLQPTDYGKDAVVEKRLGALDYWSCIAVKSVSFVSLH